MVTLLALGLTVTGLKVTLAVTAGPRVTVSTA
jgi:hypothetical protein